MDPDFKSATASFASWKTLDLVRSITGGPSPLLSACCRASRHFVLDELKYRTSAFLQPQTRAFDRDRPVKFLWGSNVEALKLAAGLADAALMSLTQRRRVRLDAAIFYKLVYKSTRM